MKKRREIENINETSNEENVSMTAKTIVKAQSADCYDTNGYCGIERRRRSDGGEN